VKENYEKKERHSTKKIGKKKVIHHHLKRISLVKKKKGMNTTTGERERERGILEKRRKTHSSNAKERK
jgi:hypothetical protein